MILSHQDTMTQGHPLSPSCQFNSCRVKDFYYAQSLTLSLATGLLVTTGVVVSWCRGVF